PFPCPSLFSYSAPYHQLLSSFPTRRSSDLNFLDSAYYLTLLWSNGLFLYTVTAWAAHHLYRRGYNRVTTGGTLRRRYGGHWFDRDRKSTSELQSLRHLVCRLLLEKKNITSM